MHSPNTRTSVSSQFKMNDYKNNSQLLNCEIGLFSNLFRLFACLKIHLLQQIKTMKVQGKHLGNAMGFLYLIEVHARSI